MNDATLPAPAGAPGNAGANAMAAAHIHANMSLLEGALTCAELAALLHLTVKTVYNRLSRDPGRLPAHIRVEGRTLFPRPWVEEYLHRCSRVVRHTCR